MDKLKLFVPVLLCVLCFPVQDFIVVNQPLAFTKLTGSLQQLMPNQHGARPDPLADGNLKVDLLLAQWE